MASYESTNANIDAMVVTTPTEGSTPPSEINNAIREIKYALNNMWDIHKTSGNVTLTVQHGVVFGNGAHTVTLPQISAVANNNDATKVYYIRNIHASSNITLKTYSSENLNGVDRSSTGYTIPPGMAMWVATDGTGWYTFEPFQEHDLADICELQRANFAYKDADEIYLNPGAYLHVGTKTQALSWDSQLTYQVGSGGTNSDSSAVGTSEWHYLYIDDSALTAGSKILTNAMFLDSTDAPAYSNTKKGYYGGQGSENDTASDRCVFAFYIDGSGNVAEFFHDEDFCFYANEVADRTLTDIDTTWTDVTLTIPSMARKANVTFIMDYASAAAATTAYWRTNGQSGLAGHIMGYTGPNSRYSVNASNVVTDSTFKIEIKCSASSNHKLAVNTNGWYFPRGL